jgi:hypothetical protein
MNKVRLTPANVSKYIGHEIYFKTHGGIVTKKIISVSDTGKTITIDHPDLKNNLEIVSRNIFVILNN